MTMKELAIDIAWFTLAVVCACISINVILNSIDQRVKKKRRDMKVKEFEKWLETLEKKDIDKK